jgi:hypothetical protein
MVKIEFNIKSKRFWLKTLGAGAFAFVVFFGGFLAGFNSSYFVGKQEGYKQALGDVTGILAQKGITLEWTELGNGAYSIKLTFADGTQVGLTAEIHMQVNQYRPYSLLNAFERALADGKTGDSSYWLNYVDNDSDGKHDLYSTDSFLIGATYHAMTLTNAGLNWIADKIANSGGTNVTAYATYIASSAATDVVSTAWTYIPGEHTTGGLGRATGAITDTGTGTWHCNKTFAVTATLSTQLYGYYYDTYANAPESTLIAAEQQGAGAVKNMNNGDSLTVSVQGTIAQG